MSWEESTISFANLASIPHIRQNHSTFPKKDLPDVWGISANINNIFGLFTTHSFTNSNLAGCQANRTEYRVQISSFHTHCSFLIHVYIPELPQQKCLTKHAFYHFILHLLVSSSRGRSLITLTRRGTQVCGTGNVNGMQIFPFSNVMQIGTWSIKVKIRSTQL